VPFYTPRKLSEITPPLTANRVHKSYSQQNLQLFITLLCCLFLLWLTWHRHGKQHWRFSSITRLLTPQTSKKHSPPFPQLLPLVGCRNEKWIVTYFSFTLRR